MTGPMHYDDLAQLGHERQATLQREAQRWRLERLGARQSQSEGETPGAFWRWLRHTLAGARWGLPAPAPGALRRPSAPGPGPAPGGADKTAPAVSVHEWRSRGVFFGIGE